MLVVVGQLSFAEGLQRRVEVRLVVLRTVAEAARVVVVPRDLRDDPRALHLPAVAHPLVGGELDSAVAAERPFRVRNEELVVSRIRVLLVRRDGGPGIVRGAQRIVRPGILTRDGREVIRPVDQDVIDELVVVAPDAVHADREQREQLVLDTDRALLQARVLDVGIHGVIGAAARLHDVDIADDVQVRIDVGAEQRGGLGIEQVVVRRLRAVVVPAVVAADDRPAVAAHVPREADSR